MSPIVRDLRVPPLPPLRVPPLLPRLPKHGSASRWIDCEEILRPFAFGGDQGLARIRASGCARALSMRLATSVTAEGV